VAGLLDTACGGSYDEGMKSVFSLVAPLALLALVSCAAQKAVRAEEGGTPEEVTGPYNVLYYNAEEGKDVVILDREDDEYEFVPFKPEDVTQRVEGVSGPEAVEGAARYLKGQEPEKWPVRIRRILDEQNRVIGFELRSRRELISRPVPNLIEIRYLLTGEGKVKVDVTVVPLMRRGP
jgi:hypothetical protein